MRSMRILVVNPNTSVAMTDKIGAAARAVAAPGTEIIAVNPADGPVSIEGYYDEVFSVPGLLAEIAKGEAFSKGETLGVSAHIIACFDDTGLDAARSFVRHPVVGICEAGLLTAGQVSKRIGVVTTLSRSIVPLEELVRKYGFAERARVYACDVPVLELEAAGAGARAKIEGQIAQALQNGADSVLLGCAGMTMLAAELSSTFDVPVIDGVAAAVKQAEALVALRLSTSKRGAYAAPLEKPYRGALAAFAPERAQD